MDPVLLSRIQFAFLIAFHFLLPAFTIGLASYIAVLEGLFLWTRRPVYLRLSAFWVRIFAVSFGMGVVSGIVMPFQLGTNWSRYSELTAAIVGPLMGYEALSAFFLEAAFLGVLLFGRKLVPPWVHFASAVIVAAGTLFSAFWILAANSWMQTPAGFEVVDGRFVPTDWIKAIFNPSFPYRLAHTVVAVYLTTAFTVIGVAAWYLRRARDVEESRVMITMGMLLATVLLPLQIVIGDLHGVNTLEHQPQKLAAIEGIWEGGPGQPAILFAIPDETLEKNHAEIGIPKLGSLYLTHSWDGHVKGLKDFPKEERPPMALPFFAFRLMVGMWLLMVGVTAWAWMLRPRGYASRAFLYASTACIPSGYVAVTAGWTTTEVGRQPWVVYGHLRTADAVSPNLTGADVAISLALYVVVYAVIFGAGLYYLMRLVQRGMPDELPEPRQDGRPARPLSAAQDA
ncbi:MAG TPA: cytochrome ubiquinol oxidase subunit I [Burkholderiales bacterium]|nr:cytochrome ubiquinol oxidase subunit I [Burkholderiales bacterium]